MLKIGVLGAGHLGKIHIKLIQELKDEYQLVGFYDIDEENAKLCAEEFGIKYYATIEELLERCDVIDVVTPTLSHYDAAVKAIKGQRHVFIEKPVTNTVEEARDLMNLAHEAKVKVQVGHVERFNPAFAASVEFLDNPMFIECHRLAQFNPRGTDVPVVLDLMIHDIDIILSVVKSSVKKVSASGVSVVSDTHDICNARLEFDNGAVANLTASRISMKNMRKSRFFQKNAYITVDFLEKEAQAFKIKNVDKNTDEYAMTIDIGNDKGQKEIYFDQPDIKPVNAIKEELRTFAEAIVNNTEPKVTIDEGYQALDVAHQILNKLKVSANLLE